MNSDELEAATDAAHSAIEWFLIIAMLRFSRARYREERAYDAACAEPHFALGGESG